jgi:glutamate dehydrogenase/leucine dehydrogenase
MKNAYIEVEKTSKEYNVTLRDAAYILAISRLKNNLK